MYTLCLQNAQQLIITYVSFETHFEERKLYLFASQLRVCACRK